MFSFISLGYNPQRFSDNALLHPNLEQLYGHGMLTIRAMTGGKGYAQRHLEHSDYDGTEGRWKALQASGIYERRAYLTEVYRNDLAREVRALGYEIESQRNAKGVDNGFEIKGVSKGLMERYSQRSEQRDESIRQFIATQGRQPTDNEVAVLVRDTRPDKLHEISTADVRRQQMERISPEERKSLADLREHALERSQTVGVEILQSSSSLQHAKDHLFERRTVAKDHELLTEALRYGRSSVDLNELRGTYELEVSRGKLLHVGGNVATEQSLERERSMVAAVDRGIGRYAALGGEEIRKTFQLHRPTPSGCTASSAVVYRMSCSGWKIPRRRAAYGLRLGRCEMGKSSSVVISPHRL